MDNYRKKSVAYWSGENLLQQQKGYFDYTSRRMFDRFLPGLTGKLILDVGCGLGMAMDTFIAQGNRVVGVDLTPQSVRDNHGRGLTVLECDAQYIPFQDDTFDVVYSLGVIEHCPDTAMALREKVRVCKPGGTVVTVVPYLFTPYYVASIFFEKITRSDVPFMLTYGKPFSQNALTTMMESAGCERVITTPYYGSAFLRVLFDEIKESAVNTIEDSFLSRWFGLVVWSIGTKQTA